MVAFGEIKQGDYQNFVAQYRSWDVPPQVFAFDSLGGNVFEAIAIANFVRLSRIPVRVSGKCYSSCAFIFLATPDRQATGEIGIHRPYYDKSYFSTLNSLDAETEFELLELVTKVFLEDIGVEQSLIEAIRTVPSDKLRIYRGRAETAASLGEESPFMEEWRISKCGSLDSDAVVAWCANSWIKHIRMNSALVEGWKERFLSNPDGEYSKSMPGMCHAHSERSQKLALVAIKNTDVSKAIESQAEVVSSRGKCVAAAEDKEVWAFFNTIKKSPGAFALFNKPARTMVLQKYAR